MRAKGPRYKKAGAGEKIVSTMSVERKRKSTHPPEGKKKKKTIQTMTPVDCDPGVREVVEDTRAAVEDMMKELNDMVEQSTPQFTLTTVYDNEGAIIKSKATMKRWTIWYALVMTCVWRPENLKRDGSM